MHNKYPRYLESNKAVDYALRYQYPGAKLCSKARVVDLLTWMAHNYASLNLIEAVKFFLDDPNQLLILSENNENRLILAQFVLGRKALLFRICYKL